MVIKMNKYEVTQRLCKELGIEYLHLNFRGKEISFSEEEYQEIKVAFAEMTLDFNKSLEEKK